MVSNVLIDLFDRVSFCKNLWKMERMACWTCYTPGGLSEIAYMMQVMGVVTSY